MEYTKATNKSKNPNYNIRCLAYIINLIAKDILKGFYKKTKIIEINMHNIYKIGDLINQQYLEIPNTPGDKFILFYI